MHYRILRHVPNTESLAFEFDRPVYELSKRNIARLDRKIELEHGEYLSLLAGRHLPPDHALIVFVAPPWGTTLDETTGLGAAPPPITDIVGKVKRTIRTTRCCSRPIYELSDRRPGDARSVGAAGLGP